MTSDDPGTGLRRSVAILAMLAFVVPLAVDPGVADGQGAATLLYVAPAVALALALGAVGAVVGAGVSVALLARHVGAYDAPGAVGDAGSQIAFVLVGVLLGAWIHRLVANRARMRATIERLRAAQREREGHLAELAHSGATDADTGLGNRRRLDAVLARLVADSQTTLTSVSVVVIDVQGLKTFRREHGHADVARLLRSLSGGWQRHLRTQDVLLRIDDARFAILLPACSEANAARVARRLVSDASDAMDCAAGAASWDGNEAPDALLERAIVAIGTVKDPGDALGVAG